MRQRFDHGMDDTDHRREKETKEQHRPISMQIYLRAQSQLLQLSPRVGGRVIGTHV